MKRIKYCIITVMILILAGMLAGCGSGATSGGGGGGHVTGFAYPLAVAKCFGGISYEGSQGMCAAQDSGVVIAGTAVSNDGDVSGHHSGGTLGWDFWILKISTEGTLEWQKCFGGSGDEYARSIIKTADGGYAAAGESTSNDGDVSGNNGSSDFMVLKMTANGTKEWAYLYGGSGDDQGKAIKQTADSGYVLIGESTSSNGDLIANYGGYDYWVVKLSTAGIIEWQRNLGGTSNDTAHDIVIAADGGYFIIGESQSTDEVVTGHHGDNTTTDIWLVKLTSNGTLEWQKSIGGSDIDNAGRAMLATDGGLLLTGYTGSNNGDITGNHGLGDAFVIKLTSAGTIEWQHCYGGTNDDYSNEIISVPGGYLVAGASASNDGDLSANNGSYDYWLFFIDTSGSLLYSKNYGGVSRDRAYSIVDLGMIENEYFIAGQTDTHSSTGEVTGNHGDSDVLAIKVKQAVL